MAEKKPSLIEAARRGREQKVAQANAPIPPPGKVRCDAGCSVPVGDNVYKTYESCGPDSRWALCVKCGGTGWTDVPEAKTIKTWQELQAENDAIKAAGVVSTKHGEPVKPAVKITPTPALSPEEKRRKKIEKKRRAAERKGEKYPKDISKPPGGSTKLLTWKEDGEVIGAMQVPGCPETFTTQAMSERVVYHKLHDAWVKWRDAQPKTEEVSP